MWLGWKVLEVCFVILEGGGLLYFGKSGRGDSDFFLGGRFFKDV